MANPARHKDSLVRTAMRLFREQGYASTGLQQILAESGAPKGSLYYYFPGGKEQLGAEAVRLAGRLMGEKLAELAAAADTPAAFAKAYCATMAGWMQGSQFRSGCPIATTMLETAPDQPELTKAGAEALDHWIDVIAPVFRRDGSSAPRARARAQHLIAAMEGALILARIRRSPRPIHDIAASYREA
ncbi:MAG: TetR/AcrR family transcriptional regulator [Hyphomicrobiaceae bacterium]|nr:TetR/AcrR family transcriptional regulator [Hyphomicrobiaceae bacterium]